MYVALVPGLYPPDQRIPDGLRRLQVLLPVEMVIELDVGIARSQTYLSRSKVVALAIRTLTTRADSRVSHQA